jgi:hypothetical protein
VVEGDITDAMPVKYASRYVYDREPRIASHEHAHFASIDDARPHRPREEQVEQTVPRVRRIGVIDGLRFIARQRIAQWIERTFALRLVCRRYALREKDRQQGW